VTRMVQRGLNLSQSVPARAIGCLTLAVLLTLSIGIQTVAAIKEKSPRKPNIILILADDLGYGDLGSYGQKMIKTPTLDRLAKEGVRFTSCYAGSTVCAPSRASLMTGLHQGHAWIRGNSPRLPLRHSDITVAEVLKSAGYSTGIIGKWGLGEPDTTGIPNRQGFDYWFGYLNQTLAHNYYPDYLWRNLKEVEVKPGSYSHDLFTDDAIRFIREKQGGPFFLYLAYTIPHANNELREKGMQVPDDAPYSTESWPFPEKNKAAMITRMDRDIGRLLRVLQELAIDKDTVLFFTSDNGPHMESGVKPQFFGSSGGLRGIKRDLYEGGIRVPMIVRWPGKIEPNRVSNQVWASWDILPTAAEIAGARTPRGIDGISMLPVLLGRSQRNHKNLYWEFHEGGFKQAARMGKWKAVRNGIDKPIELYDLEADKAESRDLAVTTPKIVRQMEAILIKARSHSEAWPGKSEPLTGSK
jgi:arylsulfatase A-like enzyme